ncbi:serpentine type 7TM GPCR chemoreceptor str domain-containing protein [Ditylenchus destructor]|uniref:Serpentine type 7TM GPCR chemoreceptor str domain-containing protein n=1 Tax=Ditylenchus destructor TaxID=166010 RepID=A0AAD4MQY2_9BILA|nr:serpentine type 7TM GPCR chemoreceptor str domain-containing protein [Ditylenchus destructor]
MAGMSISRIHHYMETTIGILSLIANLTLLYLIITKSQFRVKAYKKILLVTCLVDLFYTLTVFIGQPVSDMILIKTLVDICSEVGSSYNS